MIKYVWCVYFVALASLWCFLSLMIDVNGQVSDIASKAERSYNLSFVTCEIKSWNTKYVRNVKKSYFFVNKYAKNRGVKLTFDMHESFTDEVWVYAEYWYRKDDQSPWSVKNTLRNISVCEALETPEELWARMSSMVRDQLPRTCPWPKGEKIKLAVDILEEQFPPIMPGKEFHICLVFYEHLPQNLPYYGPEKKLLELRGFVKLEGNA